MTTEHLTKKQKKKIREARIIILTAFNWSETKKGWKYWNNVNNALKRMANPKPKICSKHGQEIKK